MFVSLACKYDLKLIYLEQMASVLLVEDWLKHLGYTEYTQSFIDNGYDDIEVCKQIGSADLDAIGVVNQRHRKLILEAVLQLSRQNDGEHVGSIQKPMYFILENPDSPANKKNPSHCNHSNSNPSSGNSSLSSKSQGISSSSTSGISVQRGTSSCEEGSIDLEVENDTRDTNSSLGGDSSGLVNSTVQQLNPALISVLSNGNSFLSTRDSKGEMFGSNNSFSNLLPIQRNFKAHSPLTGGGHGGGGSKFLLDVSDSFEMEEMDSSTSKTSSSISSSLKSQNKVSIFFSIFFS